MYKIQAYDRRLGWFNLTRAGESEGEALRMFEGYRRGYPADKHRVVLVDSTGPIERYTVVAA